MSICITITRRGYRYTCNCGDADIELYDDGYLCLSCDSYRSVDSCSAESKAAKKAAGLCPTEKPIYGQPVIGIENKENDEQ